MEHTEYINCGKRITGRRDEILLLRLFVDSRIIVDLTTDSLLLTQKLKAKCARLHKENFPWLIDLKLLSIDEALDERAPSVCNKSTTPRGEWMQVAWLMRQCTRPCTTLMDASLSATYEVCISYFLPNANVRQPPVFLSRLPLFHIDLLPAFVFCNGFRWCNLDQHRVLRG